MVFKMFIMEKSRGKLVFIFCGKNWEKYIYGNQDMNYPRWRIFLSGWEYAVPPSIMWGPKKLRDVNAWIALSSAPVTMFACWSLSISAIWSWKKEIVKSNFHLGNRLQLFVVQAAGRIICFSIPWYEDKHFHFPAQSPTNTKCRTF